MRCVACSLMFISVMPPVTMAHWQTASISLSNNSFGRIHLAAEIFDIILRNNYKLHTVWCNNNVFTGMQARQRFAVSNDKTPEEERYARTTLNAARSKMQAAVHVYVNEQIKPKSQRVKVIPDAGNYIIIPFLLSPPSTVLFMCQPCRSHVYRCRAGAAELAF